MRVEYELSIIVSYPTSATRIIFFIKNALKISRILTDFICKKTTRFQLDLNFEQTRTVTIFGEDGTGSYTMMAMPIRALELNYPMIQFLIMIHS